MPLGLKRWLARLGVTNATELTWWQSARHPGSSVNFTLTPAQHWSARTPFDRRATLWGGWAAVDAGGGGDGGGGHSGGSAENTANGAASGGSGGGARFWFAGDTGYAPFFEELGARLGPFDLAAIPVGAYEPRGFMRAQHIGPAEAVRVHKEVGARRSIGIHCCTFHLTLGEPMGRRVGQGGGLGLWVGGAAFALDGGGGKIAPCRPQNTHRANSCNTMATPHNTTRSIHNNPTLRNTPPTEPLDEPPRLLAAEAAAAGLAADEFVVLQHGAGLSVAGGGGGEIVAPARLQTLPLPSPSPRPAGQQVWPVADGRGGGGEALAAAAAARREEL